MKLQCFLPLCGFLILVRFQQGTSTPSSTSPSTLVDYGDCSLAITYILELKEQINRLVQNLSQGDKGHLSKAVEDFRSIIVEQKIDNLNGEIKQLKENWKNFKSDAAKQIEESSFEQKNLRIKFEKILADNEETAKQKQVQIEANLKIEIENLKANLDEAVKDIESKKKQLEEYQTKERNYSNEIEKLNTEVLSLKLKLDFSHGELIDSNYLYSEQLNKTEKNLGECKEKLPKTSCKGLSSGIYNFEIAEFDIIPALCEADIKGGGWLVIHKRFDGSVDFLRNWADYRKGFGNLTGEFFIGLDNLHRITNTQSHELYVQLGFYNESILFVSYDNFRIGNEESKYKLESMGYFRGSAMNQLHYNLNQRFSTVDNDNDGVSYNCAKTQGGPWWHNHCSLASLNGKYANASGFCADMSWGCAPLKSVQMLIRPNKYHYYNPI